jgi:hypothetical protein
MPLWHKLSIIGTIIGHKFCIVKAESTDTTRTPRTAPLVLKPLPEIPFPLLLFEWLLLPLDELEESWMWSS